MKVIVPLAGPDFVNPDGSVKSETLLDGTPLLRLALESRPWWTNGTVCDSDLIFVLHDNAASQRFASESISIWYPRSKRVFLSHYTKGAALSALVGCCLMNDLNEVVCFDLADILFDTVDSALELLNVENTGAVAVTFTSDKDIYSYLRRDSGGKVVEAAEKRVISNEASAGVYLFKSAAIYLKALANINANDGCHAANGIYFICPVMNGVLSQGFSIEGAAAGLVRDIKA